MSSSVSRHSLEESVALGSLASEFPLKYKKTNLKGKKPRGDERSGHKGRDNETGIYNMYIENEHCTDKKVNKRIEYYLRCQDK